MAMEETAETWIRINLFCDGLGDDGICVRDASGDLRMISDVAPTLEDARTAVLNAAVKSRWTVDLKLLRWLCPECVAAWSDRSCLAGLPKLNRAAAAEIDLRQAAGAAAAVAAGK